VQKHPKIGSIFAEAAADFRALQIFEEHQAKDFPILGRQGIEDTFDRTLTLGSNEGLICADGRVLDVRECVARRSIADSLMHKLQQDVVADGVYESSKARWVLQSFPLTQNLQHAVESFLAHIV
jgi:hypothetical protein